jgi:hypothetical protein
MRFAKVMTIVTLGVTLLGGCKFVTDAEYNDRAAELEASRTQFLPGSDQVNFLTAADQRFYWVSLEKPLDAPLLHSIDPTTNVQVDYAFTMGMTDISTEFQMSGDLVVDCSEFIQATAYDAATGAQLDMTVQEASRCAVVGRDVYLLVSRKILKWTPGQTNITQVVDLDAQMVGTDQIAGLTGLGTQLLFGEGTRLWLMDVTTGKATWLENPDLTSGDIELDAKGVVYNTANGPTYSAFADHSTFLLQDKVADGGYDLNHDYADIQNVADSAEYALIQDHIVYRSTRGIFAYGLDTTKVVDLLLDRNITSDDEFDAKPLYRAPSVTSDGTLFVQDQSADGDTTDRPVYRVDLTGRLR